MNKLLIATALAVISSTATADSGICNFSTNYSVDINDKQVTFEQPDGKAFVFIDDNLLIDGKPAVLSEEQHHASRQIQLGTRKMLPQIADIAIEGAELGVKATSIVITALMGDDETARQEILKPIEKINEKLKQNISETHLDTAALDKAFNETFDQELESTIEKAATKYSGKMIGNIFSAIFSGDSEELADFEFRMETLERDIETYVESNAEELEKKADALGLDLAELEKFDQQLEGVAGYPENGLFNTNEGKGCHFKSISFKD